MSAQINFKAVCKKQWTFYVNQKNIAMITTYKHNCAFDYLLAIRIHEIKAVRFENRNRQLHILVGDFKIPPLAADSLTK